jgi:hypothetical protein
MKPICSSRMYDGLDGLMLFFSDAILPIGTPCSLDRAQT